VQILKPDIDLDAFFQGVANEPSLLLLDYDGTLAPFTPDIENAHPYEGVIPLLHAIQVNQKTKIVIISGRSLVGLKRLLPMDPMPELWGSHGLERLREGEAHHTQLPISPKVLEGLAIAKQRDQGHFDPCRSEYKPFSIAIHWRGLEEPIAQNVRNTALSLWNDLQQYDLEIHPFNGGMELRPQGIGKGNAINILLDEWKDRKIVAYLGDDATDENAFEALGSRGLKALVSAEPRPTAADLYLKPPEDLLDFLSRWKGQTA
jgi:trehalose-phosphatase